MSDTARSKRLLEGAGEKKCAALFLRYFEAVAKRNEYWNKWITSECWISIILDCYNVPESLQFTAGDLNNAIGRNVVYKANNLAVTSMSNDKGIYMSRRKPKNCKPITAYYVTKPKTKPQKAGGNTEWFDVLVESQPRATNTRQNPVLKRSLPIESAPTKTSAPARKKKKGGIATRSSNTDTVIDLTRNKETGQFQVETVDEDKEKENKPSQPDPLATIPLSQRIAEQDWWDAPEAYQHFADKKRRIGPDAEMMTAIEYAEERIERLKQGFSSPQGWKLVLDDLDARDICTSHDIYGIQMKCKYLSLALRNALRDMGVGHTWEQCCKDAITDISNFEGLNHITSARTIMTWHIQFRASDECFPNPKFHTRYGKAALPPLLEQYPELKQSLVQYATSNLDVLSAELLLAWLHDTALPALLIERRKELEKPTLSMAELLKECRLTKLSIPTIYRWM
jgi:hypothetical protein